VLEVTDDKSLPKEDRKKLQVLHASKKSLLARKIKLADKICNVYDIIHNPPDSWSIERKLQYLDWAERVLTGLKGANRKLEDRLQELINEGRLIWKSVTTA
jgi:guanosine-3',5'-bis(diphosphate) 3'-pyrophosphohydrolase